MSTKTGFRCVIVLSRRALLAAGLASLVSLVSRAELANLVGPVGLPDPGEPVDSAEPVDPAGMPGWSGLAGLASLTHWWGVTAAYAATPSDGRESAASSLDDRAGAATVLAGHEGATASLDDRAGAALLVEAGLSEETARTLVERWQETESANLEELVERVRDASGRGAPVDLVADKALEGLAKRVPPPRLLDALDHWSDGLARAAAMASELRGEFEPKGITEREATLRLSVLARRPEGMEWVERLRTEARNQGADLPRLLRVGEAMEQLARVGLEAEEAGILGSLWLDRDLQPGEIGRFVRVIQRGGQAVPAVRMVQQISEGLQRQQSSAEILEALERELERAGVGEGAMGPPMMEGFPLGGFPLGEHPGRGVGPGESDKSREPGPPAWVDPPGLSRPNDNDESPTDNGSDDSGRDDTPERDDPPGRGPDEHPGRGPEDNPGRAPEDNPGRGADQ